MDERLTLAPFEPHHTEGVTVNEYHYLAENPDAKSEAWSAFWDGELIAVSGGILLNGKVGGWVLFTDKINPQSFLQFHRTMKKVVEEYMEYGKTVFLHIDPEFEASKRWAKAMGFVYITDDVVRGKTVQRFERWS